VGGLPGAAAPQTCGCHTSERQREDTTHASPQNGHGFPA
jgi:hypothetical protein